MLLELHALMLSSQHTLTHFVKSSENAPSSNLLELSIQGWYIKILPQMQTLAKPTRFINHLRRQSVCACVCVCVASVPVTLSLLSSFRKWPLFTCHTLLPPPTHTYTQMLQCDAAWNLGYLFQLCTCCHLKNRNGSKATTKMMLLKKIKGRKTI